MTDPKRTQFRLSFVLATITVVAIGVVGVRVNQIIRADAPLAAALDESFYPFTLGFVPALLSSVVLLWRPRQAAIPFGVVFLCAAVWLLAYQLTRGGWFPYVDTTCLTSLALAPTLTLIRCFLTRIAVVEFLLACGGAVVTGMLAEAMQNCIWYVYEYPEVFA